MSSFDDQLQKVQTAPGFIAALDQSGGSTPRALASYGIGEDEWSGEDEMFDAVHAALGAGDCVCLFPEGISHNEPSLQPLSV